MDIKPIVINGLAGGVSAWLMATFISWLHKRYTKDVPSDKKELTYEVEQYRTIQVIENFEITFSTCCTALKMLKKSKIKNIDRINRVITARIGISFRSFGEKLMISIKEISPQLMEVCIESKPSFLGTTVDYGKNFENIEVISAYVTDVLPTGSV